MRRGTRAAAVLAAAALAAACGGDGGELRDATRTREQMRAAQMDSLARDSAAAAQARGGDTALAVPVFADPPADTAKAAAAPVDSTAAPAPAPSDSSTGGQPAAPPPAGTPPGAPGEWAAGVREARRPGVAGTLTGLRSARQAGFDRVTLQFDAARVPTYHLEYVPRPTAQCASGQATQADGRAWLLVRLSSARAHDDAGQATVLAREQKPALPAIREVEITCDFEGEVALVVGVSDRKPYRVSELSNPTRLVVDVQQ